MIWLRKTATLGLVALAATACGGGGAQSGLGLPGDPAPSGQLEHLTIGGERVEYPAEAADIMPQLAAEFERLAATLPADGPVPPLQPEVAYPSATELELELSWDYFLTGDFDLNHEVNPADLVYLARYFGRTSASPDWSEARWADGNGDGETSLADVAAIARQLGRSADLTLLYSPLADGPWIEYMHPLGEPQVTPDRNVTLKIWRMDSGLHWQAVPAGNALLPAPRGFATEYWSGRPAENAVKWWKTGAGSYEIFRDDLTEVYATLPPGSDRFVDAAAEPLRKYSYYLRRVDAGQPSLLAAAGPLARVADSLAWEGRETGQTGGELCAAAMVDGRPHLAWVDAVAGQLYLTYAASADPQAAADWRTVLVGPATAPDLGGQISLAEVDGCPAISFGRLTALTDSLWLCYAHAAVPQPTGPEDFAINVIGMPGGGENSQLMEIDGRPVIATNSSPDGLLVLWGTQSRPRFDPGEQWDFSDWLITEWLNTFANEYDLAEIAGRPAIAYNGTFYSNAGIERQLACLQATVPYPQGAADWQSINLRTTPLWSGGLCLLDRNPELELVGPTAQGMVEIQPGTGPDPAEWLVTPVSPPGGDTPRAFQRRQGRLFLTYQFRGGNILAWRDGAGQPWQSSWIAGYAAQGDIFVLNGKPAAFAYEYGADGAERLSGLRLITPVVW